jgi:predicted kinase
MDVAHLLMSGGASSSLDSTLTKREAKDLRRKLARKRPVGFAPWPNA